MSVRPEHPPGLGRHREEPTSEDALTRRLSCSGDVMEIGGIVLSPDGETDAVPVDEWNALKRSDSPVVRCWHAADEHRAEVQRRETRTRGHPR